MTVGEPTHEAHVSAFTGRLARLRDRMTSEDLDALLVTNPENRRYLSGFTGQDDRADSAGALLVSLSHVVLITDGRYVEVAAKECPGLEIVQRQGGFAEVAASAIANSGAKAVGFEATHLTVATRDDLDAALAKASAEQGQARLVPTRSLVEPLRMIKDEQELALIERAVAITDETFAHLCEYLRPGMTEHEVAFEIERFMRSRGAEGMAFDPIVASGPNSSSPHIEPGQRVIGKGEPVTIDMGSQYEGYGSDMTRTICFGEPTAEMLAIYDAVVRALETCEAGIRPGMTGQQADALARDSLVEAGYGDYFVHSTGHGVGLEIHEGPRLSRFAPDDVLQPGMIITIEPGVYMPGKGGVRVEDIAVVTESGIRVLNSSHKRFVLA